MIIFVRTCDDKRINTNCIAKIEGAEVASYGRVFNLYAQNEHGCDILIGRAYRKDLDESIKASKGHILLDLQER